MPSLNDIKAGDRLPELVFAPDEVQLFLYNAAVWNAHRIHYDKPYATKCEGHANVVIDGPLQGDWLSQIVMAWIADGGQLISLGYSNRRSACLGEKLRAEGVVETVDSETGLVRISLTVRNELGQVITPGTAAVRLSR